MTFPILLVALLAAGSAPAASDARSLAKGPAPLRAISGAPAVPALSPEDAALLAAVDWAAVREQGARLLSGFIQVKSHSGDEAAAADFFESAARGLGLAAERLDGNGSWNVYVGTRLDAPPRSKARCCTR